MTRALCITLMVLVIVGLINYLATHDPDARRRKALVRAGRRGRR